VPAGLTLIELPLILPGFQLYVVAPPPVNVVDPPLQIEAGLALAVTEGADPTVTVTGILNHPAHVPTQ
jgi:hypothetical protein